MFNESSIFLPLLLLIIDVFAMPMMMMMFYFSGSDKQLSQNYTSAAALRQQLERTENKRQHNVQKGETELWNSALTSTLYTGPSGTSKVEPIPPTERIKKDEERTTNN